MNFDELVKTALIGTGRGDISYPSAGVPLGDVLSTLLLASPESRLLSLAAVVSVYESCGRAPASNVSPPAQAAADVHPPCTRRAGELLERLLAMPDTPVRHQLMDEWLDAARHAGRAVPHRALPALLDYGANHRASHERIAAVIDERGRWLMAQNASWQFAIDEEEDVRQRWTTGTQEQRLHAIRRLRQTDPVAVHELIRSTWSEDSADERAAFVGSLAPALGDRDEPFLESALDDRSKQVRAAAAELLARLPRSAFVRRMIERAGSILRFEPGTKGGWLSKGKPATLEIILPAEMDASWARDGITEKPALRIGQRQWWSQQIIAAVPPAHWSTTWRISPAQCIAAVTGDFTDILLTAWGEASRRHPDSQWAAALLRAAVQEGRGALRVELLNVLPDPARLSLLAEMLESPRLAIEVVGQFIGAMRFAFDDRVANALLGRIDRYVAAATPAFDYQVQQIVNAVALRVPPGVHDELAARWVGAFWEANRKALDQCLATLQIRRDIQREFST